MNRRSEPTEGNSAQQDVAAMGMYLLVLALSMFFAAGMVGYLVIRGTHQPWPPPGLPALPRSLWLSTLVIVLASAAIQRALAALRLGEVRAATQKLMATLALGVTFLALQTWAWLQIFEQMDLPAESWGPYLKLFYVLTGLHAAHVLGGLGTLVMVTRRAMAGRYSAHYCSGVRLAAIYWHFLDAVWCALFTVVYLL